MKNNYKSKKVIIITGAANGIANQIAKDLDLKENILCLFDKDKKILKIAKNFKNSTIEVFCGDVSNEDDVKLFVKSISNKYKKINTLINAAATVPYELFEKTSASSFSDVLKINLGGYFLFCREVLPFMKKNKSGVVVNISSISSFIGIPGQSYYASSKGGINALTKVLAVEYGKFNIRVNAIAPGSIIVKRNEKNMSSKEYLEKINNVVPLSRIGKPKDISGVAKFLISDEASYISGQVIIVDGGMTSKIF